MTDRKSAELQARLDGVEAKAAAWDKWSKLICDMQEHNFPHQHSFSYLREEMRAMLAAPKLRT